MRALVTGGAGFAGSHLTEYLLREGAEVTVLAREGEHLANLDAVRSQIRVETGDVLDVGRLTELLRDIKPQRIYHLAGFSSPAASLRHPKPTFEINFTGTYNLLAAWRELGLDARLLCVSSSQVYGRLSREDLPVREDAPFRPTTPYAASKAAAELLAFQFSQSYGLPIVRARPFNHTGPRQGSEFVCSSFARQIAEVEAGLRPAVVRVGNLETCRDFSDVRDIVRGYCLALDKGQPGEVYQFGSGRCSSIQTVLGILTALSSKPVRVEVDESRLRSDEAPALWGDLTKARDALGWEPRYELGATLRDLKAHWDRTLEREKAAAER